MLPVIFEATAKERNWILNEIIYAIFIILQMNGLTLMKTFHQIIFFSLKLQSTTYLNKRGMWNCNKSNFLLELNWYEIMIELNDNKSKHFWIFIMITNLITLVLYKLVMVYMKIRNADSAQKNQYGAQRLLYSKLWIIIVMSYLKWITDRKHTHLFH